MARLLAVASIVTALVAVARSAPPVDQPDNSWVKRPAAVAPLTYTESAMAFDSRVGRFITWGGHIGGFPATGPEGELVHLYDVAANRWTDPNPVTTPEGACCVRDIVFDRSLGRTVIFGGHSYAHGWQYRPAGTPRWSVPWTFDAVEQKWTAMRPLPAPGIRPYRGAAYDSRHEVTVCTGGEGARHGTVAYDSYSNTWHDLRPAGDIAGPDFAYNRMFPVFGYSLRDRCFYLFGGSKNNDLLKFDLAANAWTKLTPTGDVPPVDRRVGVFDTANNVLLVFGRADLAGDSSEIASWAYDPASNAFRRMKPAAQPGPYKGNRYIAAYSPADNLVLFKQEDNDYKAFWTYRYATPKRVTDAPLAAPAELAAVTGDGKITLTWKPVAGASGYQVLRGVGPVPWQSAFAPMTERPVEATTFIDASPDTEKTTFYRVRAIDAKGRAGAESGLARCRPARPFGLVCSVVDKHCELTWERSPEPDVIGYHVYRLADPTIRKRGNGFAAAGWPAGPKFERLTDKPVVEPRFSDGGAALGADGDGGYCYRVTAVNRLGLQSGPSPFAVSVPSSPLGLTVADQDDGTCKLSWKPNPEKGIAGYVVYRISRRESERGTSKLTAEPVKGTSFHDTTDPGPKLRRYVVAAVDALGQEGIASNSVFGQFAHRRD